MEVRTSLATRTADRARSLFILLRAVTAVAMALLGPFSLAAAPTATASSYAQGSAVIEERSAVADDIHLAMAQLPLSFVVNRGQMDSAARFAVNSPGQAVYFTPSAVVFRATHPTEREGVASVVRLHFAGANTDPVIEGLEPLPGKANFLLGNDPAKWYSNVPTCAAVAYREVYPGIDLVYRGTEGRLKSEFLVSPGARPEMIRLVYTGAESVRLRDDGALVLETQWGTLTEAAPVVYQEIDGRRVEIDGRYRLGDDGQVSFALTAYDADCPLVIDPVLAYSTYIGGNGWDYAGGMAVDASGYVYISGTIDATSVPNIPEALTAARLGPGGGRDGFVAKLNPTGTELLYFTYFGGSGSELAGAIAVDDTGAIYLSGSTLSSDFPTTAGSFRPTFGAGGTWEGYVTKMNSSGSALLYSTYLGGNGYVNPRDLTLDSWGCVYVTGNTNSTDFPTTPDAVQPSFGGGEGDGFVTRLNATGSALLYSTYLGGTSQDHSHSIAVDSWGYTYLAGFTDSSDFPVAAALQPSLAGGSDAFVAKLNHTGTALVYSTFLGGDGSDMGFSVVVDSAGCAYVTGDAGFYNATAFPVTANAFQKYHAGGTCDAFVAKLNPTGSALAYSSLLGGNTDDHGSDIAIDHSGQAYVTGNTESLDFPRMDAFQGNHGGGKDAFAAKVDATGSSLIYSTYLGGVGDDRGHCIAVDSAGNAYITGITGSTDFPVAPALSPLQGAYGGGTYDGFVAKLSAGGSSPLIVTTTADSGAGSLREAILSANAHPGLDTITFNILARGGTYDYTTGTWTIYLASALPALTDHAGVFIDGSSQAAYVIGLGDPEPNPNGPEIVIDGSAVLGWGSRDGIIEVAASNCRISQLTLCNAEDAYGLNASGCASLHVDGCYIGVDDVGMAAAPNYGGIRLSGCSDCRVTENLVSANLHHGVAIADCSHIDVAGNLIGSNRMGAETDLGNEETGVLVTKCGLDIVIGTDGDGANDAAEGNVIIGTASPFPVCYGVSILEPSAACGWLPGAPPRYVIAGNRLTAHEIAIALVDCHGARVGSNNDGVSDALEGNVVVGNGEAITVWPESTGNTLSRNVLEGCGVGIDLLPTPTFNENDGMLNPLQGNNGMDAPVLTEATLLGDTVIVSGYVGNEPAGSPVFAGARIEIFDCEATFSGEAGSYVGHLIADANSCFTGTIDAAAFLRGGIAATATHTSGDTSELSGGGLVIPPEVVASIASTPAPGTAVSHEDEIVFTIEILNISDASQPDLPTHEFTDELPPGVVYVSGTAVREGTGLPWGTLDAAPTGGSDHDVVTWDGSIPGNEKVVITFTVRVDPSVLGEVCNSDAFVTWSGGVIALDDLCFPLGSSPYITARVASDPPGGTTESVEPGDRITYTVTIENAGILDQADLVTYEFENTLPDDTVYVPGSATATRNATSEEWGTFHIAGNHLAWDGTIPAEDKIIVVFDAEVLPTAQASICNSGGEVHWDGGTETLDAGCIPVASFAGIHGTKTAIDDDQAPLEPNDTITYTVTIWNDGHGTQADNPGHEFEDTIPDNTTYETGTASALRGADPCGTVAYESGKIVWDGSIPTGDYVRIVFQVRVALDTPYGTRICNSDAVIHWDADGDLVNEAELALDPACGTVTAVGAPLLEAAKTEADENGAPLLVGDAILYTITISNTGTGEQVDDPASHELRDPIPLGTTYVEGSLTAASGAAAYDATANEITWNGTIPADAATVVSFRVMVDDSALEAERIANLAVIHWDPDGDGSSQFETEVRTPGFATPNEEPHAAQVSATIAATDIDGSPLEGLDTVRYRVTIRNTGANPQADDPSSHEFSQPIPEHTTYVAGSATASRSSGSTGVQPSSVLLGIHYDSAAGALYWDGSIPAGEGILIEYEVLVDRLVASGTVVVCCGCVFWDADGDGINDTEYCASVTLTVDASAVSVGEIIAAPNPVGDFGVIFTFDLPDDTAAAWLKLFDIDGALLFSEDLVPGAGSFPIAGRWIPQDNIGRPLGNGLYLYVITIRHADGRLTRSEICKLVVAR